MRTITELYEKWNSITPYSDGFLLVSDDHPLAFHIGIQGENEKIFVVLNTGKVNDIASSKAVSAENIILEDGSYALHFSLKYSSLDELFVKLCWDLMESSKNSDKPLDTFIEQYKKWQRLLQKVNNGILPASSQKGIIGELLFMKERAQAEGIETALSAWIGPEGADQDFDFSVYWAEVKTTTIAGNSVLISSLQQLDRTDKGFLAVYFMDKTTSNGHNVVSLDSTVSEIESMLETDKQKNTFTCKLARVGFMDKDRDKYKNTRFRLSNREIFSVTEDFPRLTKYNVRPEITDAKYSIDLASISSLITQEI